MIGLFAGRKIFQTFFRKLHTLSLVGMNYSRASRHGHNGEKNVLRSLRDQLDGSEELVLFDVGANVGAYSEDVLEVFKNRRFRLFSFEPSKATFKILAEQFTNQPQVHLANIGLSDREGEIVLYSDDELSPLSSVYPRNLEHVDIHFSQTQTIQVSTLDKFCLENDIDQIDFMKLDVEGHEMAVFEGAKDMIARQAIKFVQFEFGGCNIDSRTFFRDFFLLLNPKFKLYRVVTDGLVEIATYSEKLEVFQSINFLAVHRSLDFSE